MESATRSFSGSLLSHPTLKKIAVPTARVGAPGDPSTGEAVLRPEERLEFKASLGDIVTPCLKKQQRTVVVSPFVRMCAAVLH